MVFFVTESSKAALIEQCPKMSSSCQSLIAGAFAGFASLSIFVPLELLKCRAQIDKQGGVSYSQVVSDLYKAQGLRGLYRGFWATAWRDTPAWAVYFASYEYLKNLSESDSTSTGSSII